MKSKKPTLSDVKNFIDLNGGGVCYLSGDDLFFTEEAMNLVKDRKLDEFSRDFNYNVFYGCETDMEKVVDTIKTLPIMTKNRLVIIQQAHQLRDSDWKILTPVLLRPVSSTFLVFVGDKPDKRKKSIKEAMKSVTHFHFVKPYEREFPKWIKFICNKHSVEIEKDVPDLLLEIVGPSLMEIQNEVLKLSCYTGKGRKVSSTDVITVASKIRLKNIFNLTEAIGKKNLLQALLCLEELLESGQNEVGITAMIHRHIRLLRQTIIGKKQGLHGLELANFAGVPSFFLKDFLSQTQFWNEEKIQEAYKLLCNTDKALKSSPLSSHIPLENFIMQTCSQQQ